jgi:hypothetical protein
MKKKGHPTAQGRRTTVKCGGEKKKRTTTTTRIHTPVTAAIPDALVRVHVDVRDPTRGTLFAGVVPSVRNHDKFVVRSHGRGLISDEDYIGQTTLPLRPVVDESKGGGVHRLRGVIGAGWEALQDRVLLRRVAWAEQPREEIKLGLKLPWCGRRRHVGWGGGPWLWRIYIHNIRERDSTKRKTYDR